MQALVRPARPEDAGACLSIYAPYVRDTAASFETEPPDEATLAGRIRDTLPHKPWLVAEADGEVAGYAYASAYRPRAAYQWSVEVTVYVRPYLHGHGVGGALYTRLIECLRVQGFVNAYAVITLPNPASVALHERHGFEPLTVFRAVGHKLGQWHDVGWWHLRIQQPPVPASPPQPFAEVRPALFGAPE